VLYAVIPAGGAGTRLWPLSRASHPKFLHALTGTSASLIQATVGRLGGLTSPETTMVVTGASHAADVARQLPDLPSENILVEPLPRDSCAAIGLAAAVIAERDPEAVMGAFPADHLIVDVQAFQACVLAGVSGALAGKLMTIGITPTRPETGYGYLRCTSDEGRTREVAEFAEKPDKARAVTYLESGEYLWNAGMFIWKVDVFLSELARQQPELHDGLRRIAAAWHGPRRDDRMSEVWPGLKKISVDYAVMEGAAAEGLVGTVPGEFGWNDVGDFHTLGDILPGDDRGNVVLEAADTKGEVILRDSERVVVVPRSGRLIAAVGMRDAVIVDTEDALLVCPRDRAQEVKAIVDGLKERGATDLL
jgi:mannose-1-phosphate guanylyltransferase